MFKQNQGRVNTRYFINHFINCFIQDILTLLLTILLIQQLCVITKQYFNYETIRTIDVKNNFDDQNYPMITLTIEPDKNPILLLCQTDNWDIYKIGFIKKFEDCPQKSPKDLLDKKIIDRFYRGIYFEMFGQTYNLSVFPTLTLGWSMTLGDIRYSLKSMKNKAWCMKHGEWSESLA